MSDASTVFDLHGRLALVTGGASGIGAGIAAMLAAAGAHVVIADRDAVAATRTVAALTQQSPPADAVPLAPADDAPIVKARAEVADRLDRSEARRLGRECVSTCRIRFSPLKSK